MATSNKHSDTAFKERIFSLPRDALLEMFSFLPSYEVRSIMANDVDGVLNDRCNIEDYYCREHGTRMKTNEGKTDVLKKIKDDGLDPNLFLEKLRERTDYFNAEDGDSNCPDLPFEDDGEVYKKYLKMMSTCDECEEQAVKVEMAKRGRELCDGCGNYINVKREKFNYLVDNTTRICSLCMRKNLFCKNFGKDTEL